MERRIAPINVFCIPIRVEDEEALYDKYYPSGRSFSGELVAYLQDYIVDHRLGEDIAIEIQATKRPDMERFRDTYQAYVDKLIRRNKRVIRRSDLKALAALLLARSLLSSAIQQPVGWIRSAPRSSLQSVLFPCGLPLISTMSEQLAALSEKAAKASEDAKVARELREEAISDQISTVKGDIAAFEEEVRLVKEENQSRLRSALLKIKMTIESKIRERREYKDQVLMQLYVADQLDYIDECFAGAAYLISNAQLAMYETMEAIKEYEAKYGKMGEADVEAEA